MSRYRRDHPISSSHSSDIEALNLVSVYQQASFKPHSKGKNEAPIPNRLARQFNQEKPLEAIVADLTYVRVGKRWAYVCLIIDLYNREIIGLSVGWQKAAELVKQAIQSIPYALTKVNLFHSDRGKKFDNHLIDEVLGAFGITRSLSQAGCPYDNAVSESPILPSNWNLLIKQPFIHSKN